MKKGFTLIETLIYIALFTILVGAGFYTAFALIQSGQQLDTKTATNSELDFVLRKIDWAMTGMNLIVLPNSTNPISDTLEVHRYDGKIIKFRLTHKVTPTQHNQIEIDEGLGWIALTTDNVNVESIGFQYITGDPAGVIATTTINGITATTSKYIRK